MNLRTRQRQQAIAAALIAAVLAVPAWAQSASSAAERSLGVEHFLSSSAESAARPLWLSQDGLLELSLREDDSLQLRRQVLPLPPGLPLRHSGPGSRLLIRPSQFEGIGAGLYLDTASASLQTGVGCRVSVGPALCLDRVIDSGPRVQRGRAGAFVAGTDWTLDLSYGRLALDAGSPLAFGVLQAHDDSAGGVLQTWEGEEIALTGRFSAPWLDQLSLGLSLAHWRSAPGPWLQPGELESATFSIGLSRGALSGELASRLVHAHPSRQSQYWAGLDLGISWRMPWHGELQFGAHNLVTRAATPGVATQAGAAEDIRARTPYIRYHQDF
jgi:hypothetical protein